MPEPEREDGTKTNDRYRVARSTLADLPEDAGEHTPAAGQPRTVTEYSHPRRSSLPVSIDAIPRLFRRYAGVRAYSAAYRTTLA